MSALDEMNRKTISDKWMEFLFDRLQNLNLCYMRMHEGCNDLIEYCQSTPDMISKVQYKNAGFMITYIKNILSNSHALFTAPEHKQLKGQLDILHKLHSQGLEVEGTKITVYEIEVKDSPKIEIFKLNPAFNYLVSKLDEIYNEIIIKLKSILFIEGNIKNR